MISLPRLYAILDSSCFSSPEDLFRAAEEVFNDGVALIQYRNKSGHEQVGLDQARELRRPLQARAPAPGIPKPTLIMNDRSDLCLAAEFEGVHVGQDDLLPDSARKIIGPGRWLGVSTHNPQQVIESGQRSADYAAIGPVFATGSKANPEPVIGLPG